MPLGAHAVCREAGTRAEFPGCVGPVTGAGRGGKTASFRYQEAIGGDAQAWRDDEILANRGLRSALIPVLASVLRNPVQ
jgi:hypothetical protein